MNFYDCPGHDFGGHMSSYVLMPNNHDLCRFCGQLICIDWANGMPGWVVDRFVILEEPV
jgi:hypothetical protein